MTVGRDIRIHMVVSALLSAAAMPTLARGQDWKHQIVFPDDPFCSAGISAGDFGWFKFTIKLDDPSTVYFQDSQRYVLHYDFATAVLEPFVGISPAEYYSLTLYEQGQQAVLGTVIMPPHQTGSPPYKKRDSPFSGQRSGGRRPLPCVFGPKTHPPPTKSDILPPLPDIRLTAFPR